MSLRSQIDRQILQFKLRSFLRSREIRFKQSAVEARRILVFFPAFNSADEAVREAEQWVSVFKDRELLALVDGATAPDIRDLQTLRLDPSLLENPTSRRLDLHEPLQNRLRNPFDLFLDLNGRHPFISLYLCEKCRFPLRICLNTHPDTGLFNIQFNGTDTGGLVGMIEGFLDHSN